MNTASKGEEAGVRGIGLFMTFLGVVPALAVALGCVIFAVRAKSSLAAALAAASVAQLIAVFASAFFRAVVLPLMAKSFESVRMITTVQVGTDVAIVLAGLVFAVLLGIVLHRSVAPSRAVAEFGRGDDRTGPT
jgi:hypothetical protein